MIYAFGFHYSFIEIDDGAQLLENPFLEEFSLSNLISIFTTDVVAMYQPFTTFCLAIITAIFGMKSAFAFHVFSFLIHATNTVLICKISEKLLGDRIKAVAIALIFSIHPLMVESVAWVSATSTLLFTMFYLLSMLSYINYKLEKQRHWLYYSLIFFILGAFSKVLILPFLGVMLLLDYFFAKKLSIKILRLVEKVPFFAVGLVFLIIAFHFRGGQSGFPGHDYPPVLMVPSQIVWYIYKLLFPINLGILYDWPLTPFGGFQLLSWPLLAGLLAALYHLRHNKIFVFGLVFYFFNIVLHTAFFSTFLSPYADRYAYLSTFGIWIALSSLIPTHINCKLVGAGAGTLAALYFAQSQNQIRQWQSTVSLWTHNLSHQTSTFSNGMRGAIYYKNSNFELANADFEKVDENPDTRFEPEKYSFLYTSLGIMNAEKNPDKACEYFGKVLQFNQSIESYMNYGKMLVKANRNEEAQVVYRKIMDLKKTRP
jgi:tetratricopeptide (TPR) repeat protein